MAVADEVIIICCCFIMCGDVVCWRKKRERGEDARSTNVILMEPKVNNCRNGFGLFFVHDTSERTVAKEVKISSAFYYSFIHSAMIDVDTAVFPSLLIRS